MNKRIPTLFLCLVMVVAMLVSAVPVFAEPSAHPPVTFTIKPDKTTAKPGETITYQVIIGPVENLQTAEFKLVIPDELEYNGGSSPEGLAEKMKETTAEFISSTMKCSLGGTNDYTSSSDARLVTFTCTVKEGAAAGAKPVVKVKEGEEFFFFADSEEKYYTINYDPNGAAGTIAAAPKPATGISLNKSELTLTAGNSDTSLTATVTPADSTDTVVWSTNKPAVATVDSATGKVTAVAPGEAIITATAGTKTATCTVKVQAAPCTHENKSKTPEKASNCSERGWDEYLTCDECHKLFDMNGNPIDAIPYRELNDDHDFNVGEWGYKEADGHAHVCSRNAEHHDTVQPHTPDHEEATYDHGITCTECGYVIAPQLEANDIRIEVPFKLTVKKTGEMDPGKETFKFVVERFGAPVEYVLVQDTVETEGEKTYEGKFIFTIAANQAGNLSEGFVIRQVKGNAKGWTYDETKFYVIPMCADTYTSVASWKFLKLDEKDELDYNNPIEEISFTNSYNAKKPVTPPAPQPESPETGDNSMTGLWIALLFVSGAALTGTTLYFRKKRVTNR